MKKLIRIPVLLLLLTMVMACSTKKNTVMSRYYHNTTSLYNIYFNAKEALKLSENKVKTSYKDDFNARIPLFTYATETSARLMLPDMDKTIKKCSKVIAVHSITAKPKISKRGIRTEKQREFYRKNEFNKWIDDAFLLMGKAYFMKHDFLPAIENFEYVIKQYPEDGLQPEATLWLARCQIEMEKYDDAEEILNRLQGGGELSKNLEPSLLATLADWHLRQEDISGAADYISRAIQNYPQKAQRTRMHYLLAQLYEELDEIALASQSFGEVIKLNPSYEMAFNAQINQARLYEGDPEAGADIRRRLNKMLKDDKNIDYLDQIYYALAELDMKQEDVESALKNYHLSIWSSQSNNTQRALSYLALGKYYHAQPDYIPAGTFYDSCSQFLPEQFPGYQEIIDLADDLRLLSQNMMLIQREDSLQMVARMPENIRDSIIQRKIDEAIEIQKELKALEEQEALLEASKYRDRRVRNMTIQGMSGAGTMNSNQSSNFGAGNTGGGSNVQGGGWYFYNPATLSFGASEFIKLWGRRKLEDDWRRSNKRIASMADDLSTEGEEGEVETPIIVSKASNFQPTEKDYYLADLPLNDTLMGESNERIALSLFNVGKLFRSEFSLPENATPYFVSLFERFPEHERVLPSYYNLYEIYSNELVQPDEAERYKNLILENFPNSRSAQIISNPNYFQELEETRIEVISFYQSTYESYNNGSYELVLDNCLKADTAFGLNPIRDQFGLLHAMALAQMNPSDTTSIKNALNNLVFKFPQSDIIDPVKNILNYIDNGPQSVTRPGTSSLSIGTVVKPIDEGPIEYKYEEEAIHYYITVVSSSLFDINSLSFRISDYNVENYNQDFFEVKASPLNEDLRMVVVKNFQDRKSAMDYYNALLADPKVYTDFDEMDFRHFVISQQNYGLFYSNKNVFQYLQFFREHYLQD